MIKAYAFALTLGAVVFAVSAPLGAQTTEEISQQRSVVMKKMDSAMNQISQRLGGLFAFDKKEIRRKAEQLRDAAMTINSVFPEGSATSETLPVIWTEPELFEKKITKTIVKAEKLLGELDGADKARVKKLYKGIHFSCTGCHSIFRK